MLPVSLEHGEGGHGSDGGADGHVGQQILHWQGAADLSDLVSILILLLKRDTIKLRFVISVLMYFEEHIRDILLLRALDDVGELGSVLGGDQDAVPDQSHALVGNLAFKYTFNIMHFTINVLSY